MLMDFNGSPDIPPTPSETSGENILQSLEITTTSSPETKMETLFTTQLQWLFCSSLAIIFYCLAFIGCLHKGLDSVNCTRIPKVFIIIIFCLCLFVHVCVYIYLCLCMCINNIYLTFPHQSNM